MTAKWNLIIDVEKCNGCYNCFIAAKDEYVDNAEPGYFAPQPRHGHAWIALSCVERGRVPMTDVAYVPRMCNHCDDPPCLKAATGGAVTKRPDGIVLIDPDKARGQRAIVDACPYGAVWWNEEALVPQAWPFDAHLLDRGWTRPRCVQVCATGALEALKVEDGAMAEIARARGLETLKPEAGTRPRVYYRNLHRATACFIGGHVEVEVEEGDGGRRDCLEGAQVEISRDGQAVATAVTDAFGDFKVDRLPADGGRCVVRITAPGFSPLRVETELRNSVYLGTLLFTTVPAPC